MFGCFAFSDGLASGGYMQIRYSATLDYLTSTKR